MEKSKRRIEMRKRISDKKLVEGIAFPDYIQREKVKDTHFRSFEKDYKTRDFLLLLILTVAVSLIVVRLFSLQIVSGAYYRGLSDGNRIKTVSIHAPRGIIFDRNAVPLVFNIPGFREIVNGKTRLLSTDEALTLLAKGKKDLEIDSLRSYPYRDIFSHVLGYISQISKEELDRPEFVNYRGGDLIGATGIERQYENLLRGVDGKSLLEVDSRGNEVRKLGQTDPIPGQDITLTLDKNLQEKAFDAMADVEKGAVVVSASNGEILAIISKPSFDPNIFTFGERYQPSSGSFYKSVSELLLDSDNQPLINRAISGTYPPGSTFKLVVAAAGVENKIIDESFEVEDTGVLTVGVFSFGNWYYTNYGKKEGTLNVVKALKRSNDIFFYKLAEKIGVDGISSSALQFGLGSALGIDLSGEAKGLVPTPLWKEKTLGETWFLGDTYNYGIGQGYLLATPLQVNYWTQIIANSGVGYKPHLFKNEKSKIKNEKFLSEGTVDMVRKGMIESCSAGGVAWPLFEFRIKNSKLRIDGKNFSEAPQATISAALKDYRRISIACKTGTSEHGQKDTAPHAWITLFAPAYDPQIVVTVLAEESGEGSNVAAPIAKKILEEWFGR